MVRPIVMLMMGFALATPVALADGADGRAAPSALNGAAAPSSRPLVWPVTGSIKATLQAWAKRQGWPAPQFLTDADWMVDVSGTIPGSIEEALTVLAAGFGRGAARPRIEVTANHVIVVSEVGAE